MNITANHSKYRPVSKLISKMYSMDDIIDNSFNKTHDGQSMETVFNNIFSNPYVTLGEADKSGNMPVFYNGEDIGWVNPLKFIGWIDDKAYDKLISSN